ncbi:protein phosphatase 1 regulatory subunit 37 [Caerostris extrusa]|uniref:Protein phosphatase 1 regulatory subunit 37 n=1 Tax=Caerostris extrusa TaxID=172846 RepID=A0AAV4XDR8_CAEEX|nr:protein phosphatase 1 regulatory subunit 37 [Caerostris extrusa]
MSVSELEIDIDCDLSNKFERSASAPSSPNERSTVLRDIGNVGGLAKTRRVTFPDDETIVTGYFEAPDPWGEEQHAGNKVSNLYKRVLQQLQTVQMTADLDFELNLKGENLDAHHCEALEEIFKRLQFRSLLLENSNLDDETPCLQYLDASKTSQNEQSLLILGRAFRTGSYLTALHLENCGIFGRSLVILDLGICHLIDGLCQQAANCGECLKP